MAIELDGPEHETGTLVDQQRDEELRNAGIDTVRVNERELRAGNWQSLKRIRQRCAQALELFETTAKGTEPTVAAVADCMAAARVQFALARSLQYGWLPGGGEWAVTLYGAGSVEAAGVVDALRLLAAFDDLFGCSTVPERCRVSYGDVETVWGRSSCGEWRQVPEAADHGDARKLVIRVERDAGPFAELSRDNRADLIVRSAFVPVPLQVTPDDVQVNVRHRRKLVAADEDSATRALTTVLRHVFRLREFWPRQAEAIRKVLAQEDCVVLLPTAAGKSLIYQLAGMMMPGVTVVVDPIIALMEDQVGGLEARGFDRSTSISSKTPQTQKNELLDRIERGEFQFLFLSPERLQDPGFRRRIRSLANSVQMSLAVVDEAHCVSEWGHEFRPAYLHLADRLRELGKCDPADTGPPLLGLTGTASRAVLRDMLVELRVNTVLRPASLERKELEFDICRVQGASIEKSHRALQGVLRTMPKEFRIMSVTDFYKADGPRTKAGIVFVPHATGPFGLEAVKDLVAREVRAPVALYGGESFAEDRPFKEDKKPIMVATKKFGMGVDKENVRWTVHLGMPGSIERFYQEAGRAGRARREPRPKSRCTVVFSELDRKRTDDLLDPGIEFGEAKRRYDRADGWHQADDITRALYFHFNAFKGSASEVEAVKEVMERAGDVTQGSLVVLPFPRGENKKARDEKNRTVERAVCVLRRVGVVREYDVDYGRKRFVAHFEPFDAERSRHKLGECFRVADPARAQILRREVEAAVVPESQTHALNLARLLIEFTYEQVERARRRMIREAMLLARDATDNDGIRERLADYLSEGVSAKHMDELLNAPRVDLNSWWKFVADSKHPQEAGELRGRCVRALESSPDHPGLLLTRAAAEALCSDHDQAVSATGIVDAVRIGLDKYELGEEEMKAALHRMFEAAGNGRAELAPPLAVALVRLSAAGADVPSLAFASGLLDRVCELGDPELRRLVRAEKLRWVAEQVEVASGRLKGWLGAPEVARILEGEQDGR